MKHTIAVRWLMSSVLACLPLVGGSATEEAPTPWRAAPREDWVQLWNGRDLTGWVPKIRGYAAGENFGRTFRVERGVLTVSYEAYDQFGDRLRYVFRHRPLTLGPRMIRISWSFDSSQ